MTSTANTSEDISPAATSSKSISMRVKSISLSWGNSEKCTFGANTSPWWLTYSLATTRWYIKGSNDISPGGYNPKSA